MELKNYESVIIFTPVLSDEQLKDAVAKYRQLITEHKGEIVHEQNWGLTKLAYQIQKKTTGFYQVFEFKAPGNLVAALELQYKRDERIMRFLTTALDKHAVVYNQRKRNGEFNQPKKDKEVTA
jgi:small subunit ribosomal protein S6